MFVAVAKFSSKMNFAGSEPVWRRLPQPLSLRASAISSTASIHGSQSLVHSPGNISSPFRSQHCSLLSIINSHILKPQFWLEKQMLFGTRHHTRSRSHRYRIRETALGEGISLCPELQRPCFFIHRVPDERDSVTTHMSPNSLACPPGATVPYCIVQNSWGLSKAAASLRQRPVNKLLVVHFPPCSSKGHG